MSQISGALLYLGLFCDFGFSSITPEDNSGSWQAFSKHLLNSINAQLVDPPGYDGNLTRLVIRDELMGIYNGLGGGNWTALSTFPKTDLLNHLSEASALLFQYTESVLRDEVSPAGINVLAMQHLSSLNGDELHSLWFSVQDDLGLLVYSLQGFVIRALEFVSLDLAARFDNSSSQPVIPPELLLPKFLDLPRIQNLPLSVFPRSSTVLVLGAGTGELVGWLRQTGWFGAVTGLDSTRNISQLSGGLVEEWVAESKWDLEADTVVCLDLCASKFEEYFNRLLSLKVRLVVRIPSDEELESDWPVNVDSSQKVQAHCDNENLFVFN